LFLQNSFVNYSGINEVPLKKIQLGATLKKEGIKTGNQEMIDELMQLSEADLKSYRTSKNPEIQRLLAKMNPACFS
jgi:hypothetical protein